MARRRIPYCVKDVQIPISDAPQLRYVIRSASTPERMRWQSVGLARPRTTDDPCPGISTWPGFSSERCPKWAKNLGMHIMLPIMADNHLIFKSCLLCIVDLRLAHRSSAFPARTMNPRLLRQFCCCDVYSMIFLGTRPLLIY